MVEAGGSTEVMDMILAARRHLELIEQGGEDEEGRKCIERLVERYKGLIVRQAREYANEFVPLEDLIAEGTLGFIEALKRFDVSLGYQLSTYATHWIRGWVQRAVRAYSSPIPLSARARKTLYQVQEAQMRFYAEHHRMPSVEELAKFSGVSKLRIRRVCDATAVDYLEEMVDEDWNRTPEEVVADAREWTMGVEEIDEADEVASLLSLVEELPEAERDLVKMAHGLPPYERAHTHAEIAKRFGMSRSAVGRMLQSVHKRLYERLFCEG